MAVIVVEGGECVRADGGDEHAALSGINRVQARPHLRAGASRAYVECPVDDRIHAWIGTREEEQSALNALIYVHRRVSIVPIPVIA